MKKLIVLMIAVALCAAPAMAQIQWDGGNHQCQTTVSVTIPQWAQVVCQDPDGITFSSNATTGAPSSDGSNNGAGDWYKSAASGANPHGLYASIDVGCGNKASTDPWAGAEYITGDADGSPSGIYYEATDYAHHYIRTNTDITGTVTATTLTSGSHTIPTWFTIAFAPFWEAGLQVSVATLPYDGAGAYGADGGSNTIAKTGNATGNSPHAFAADTPWSYPVAAPAFGTITLHSRILRKGMMDVAGTYTGTITVNYQ
ncbi:hypothetical protein JXJ21_25705 [candidate division KSB1 bacterium]|nr:hypothetical protein [candidate division KSB1 bacterium]